MGEPANRLSSAWRINISDYYGRSFAHVAKLRFKHSINHQTL